MEKFFSPKSVAVVGASHKKGKIGRIIAENFSSGYEGDLYFVNPDPTPILGRKPYKSVARIPGSVDLVVIAVKADVVPNVLKECVKKKVKSVIVISAGFSEMGEEGRKLEERMKRTLKGSRTRVMGPNVIGVFDPSTGVDTVFLPHGRLERPEEGGIAFVSQSGAVGSTIMDWLADEGVGVSKFVSYGNAMDVNEVDILRHLAKDPKTKVIAMYLEGVRSGGREFAETLREVTKKKPVVILKSGKGDSGTKAVSSHTGSMAGSYRVYSAAFSQFGALEAHDWEELIDYVKALSMQPLPKGDSMLVVTNGGGFGVLATDEAERQNLDLKALPDGAKKKLRGKLRSYASLHNPLDLTADSDGSMYKAAIDACSRSYDGFVLVTLFQVPTLEEGVADLIEDAQRHGKPILCCATGGEFSRKMVGALEERGVPVYPTPRRAVSAFAAMQAYARQRKASRARR